ncbi:DUF1934 domain-containing protein [Lactobacillus rodentium]|uniref:DUF1934 domain-containing protein n=1 Tax=Lactobacillus rodentium TaxID=947835 RepID=A0A2Z6T8W9_9LACO|nr:DUF1934 domain-containing protein [Lactobacillus rodentium]MCR1895137.1 DUF1934 domain-containing protein [Lactobacillus rodentium]GBG05471.1 hypothetical protein LrDSM24759_13850 [Lactobacillus rodentium]
MEKLRVEITSKITQEDQSETIKRHGQGQMEQIEGGWRFQYDEENKTGNVPVKILLKNGEMVMQRGSVEANDYTMMKFAVGEKKNCRIIAASRIMDLTSLTKKLDFSDENNNILKLTVEYDLFSGLYLIGNYAIKINFYREA